MIAKWKSGTNEHAIECAIVLANKMKLYGLNILRTKVETLNTNDCVPTNKNDNNDISNYFEFHLDYQYNTNEEFDNITRSAKKYGAGTTISALKLDRNIIIATLRAPANIGSIVAEEIKDTFILNMKSENFHTNDKVQKEFVIYDDNIEYDDDWM